MGLSRSLTIGASSLRANQQRFDVISNNLANSNTVGFKTERANFAEQFSQVYSRGNAPDVVSTTGRGGTNPMQFGLGVKLGSIQQDMTQGVIETTNRPLDMAIQGEGFFVYNSNGVDLYSRAGAVSLDRDGFLVDSNSGALLQGYNIEKDANGRIIKNSDGANKLNATMTNLQIPVDTISPPRQTENISMNGNLNAASAAGDVRKTSINIYDNFGGVRSLALTFTKTANANEYSISGAIDGKTVALSSNTVTFFNDGTLNTPNKLTINTADLNTALGSTQFDTTKTMTVTLAESTDLTKGLTQYSASNSASFKVQDGYSSGDLLSLSVDNEGKIWGAFSNGKSEVLGQTLIAKFTNPDGLIRNGDNFFIASPNSGSATIGTAGEVFKSSKILGNSLEQSNVDMTIQFTDMISTQRAFEAASRTITTSDTLLAEVNQLKR